MDKDAIIDFTAILSPLVNLATLLSCHFVKIKFRAIEGRRQLLCVITHIVIRGSWNKVFYPAIVT